MRSAASLSLRGTGHRSGTEISRKTLGKKKTLRPLRGKGKKARQSTVDTGQTTKALLATERRVLIDGTENTRDLGGIETSDGFRVKPGLLLRSDDLARLSLEGVKALTLLGVKLVADFRGPGAIERSPDRLPPDVELIHVPIFNPDHDITDELAHAMEAKDGAQLKEILKDGQAEVLMKDGYRSMVLDSKDKFAALFDKLLEDEPQPMLFHCSAGKDRTGMCAALFLLALGVPEKEVMEDYLLTNVYRKKTVEKMVKDVATFMEDAELARPLFEVRPSYLRAALDAIEAEYGSFESYLDKGLGVDQEKLAVLREQLLEKAPAKALKPSEPSLSVMQAFGNNLDSRRRFTRRTPKKLRTRWELGAT